MKYTYNFGIAAGTRDSIINIYLNGELFYRTTDIYEIRKMLNYMKYSEPGLKYGVQAVVEKFHLKGI